MKNQNKKLKKVTLTIKIIAFLFCTIIGGYGILKAPRSDQKDLEKELKQNEKALQQRETAALKKNNPTTETNSPQRTKTPGDSNQKPDFVSVIGDSVFLGAAPSFQKLYKNAVIDAKISRQVSQALKVAKKMEKRGELGNIVIISLGTNGNFNQATGQALIDYLGAQRTIYWVNAYGKNLDIQRDVNQTIDKLVKKNTNVHLIPWAKEAKKHPNWFYQDGTHLNISGQKGFSRFIHKKIKQSVTSVG